MKRLFYFCIVFSIALLLFSCNNNGNGNGNGDDDWIIGYWVLRKMYSPGTDVTYFASDGTYHVYDNYSATAEIFTGTWTFSSSQLTINIPGGPEVSTVTKISDNEFQSNDGTDTVTLYRKGYEPLGNVFDTTPMGITVNAGSYTAGTLPASEARLHSFSANGGSLYHIYWDDEFDGSGTYTCDIEVSAYRQDKTTAYFEEEDDGYTVPQTITSAATETVYIIVEGWGALDFGTYGVKVDWP